MPPRCSVWCRCWRRCRVFGFGASHGQSLLGHSVSPLARGEIPIGCPAPLSASTQKARSRNVNINSGSNRLFHRGSDYSHPRNLYSHARNPYSHPPGIFIHIAPEYALGTARAVTGHGGGSFEQTFQIVIVVLSSDREWRSVSWNVAVGLLN